MFGWIDPAISPRGRLRPDRERCTTASVGARLTPRKGTMAEKSASREGGNVVTIVGSGLLSDPGMSSVRVAMRYTRICGRRGGWVLTPGRETCRGGML